MKNRRSMLFRSVVLFLLAMFIIQVNPLFALDHVVTSADLDKAVKKASQTRQENVDKVRAFVSNLPEEGVLSNPAIKRKVESAVVLLDDEELAQLARKVEEIDADVAGGLSSGAIVAIVAAGIGGTILLLWLIAQTDEGYYYYY